MVKRKAFDIDEKVYEDFKQAAKDEGMKVSKLVELLMQDYVDMKNSYPNADR